VEARIWKGFYPLPHFHLKPLPDCLVGPAVEERKDANLLLVKQKGDVAEINFKVKEVQK